MGGKSSRDKGARGEREFAALVRDELGIDCQRNLNQTRDGGDDLPIPGWSIEVKRQEALNLNGWWTQTVLQAIANDARPALVYRQSRKPWRARVNLLDLSPMVFSTANCSHEYTAEISLEAFFELVRETMSE